MTPGTEGAGISGYKAASLLAGGAGLVIAVAGFQTWVEITSVGVRVSGTGAFSSILSWTADTPVVNHGYPIAWVTLVLGLAIIGASALHYTESLDSDSALKTIALPGFLGVVLAVLAMFNKAILIKVPEDELQGVPLSTGNGAIGVLMASIAVLVLGFVLSGLEPTYVPRPRSYSRRVTTSPATQSKSAKKKSTSKKKKKAKKKPQSKTAVSAVAAPNADHVTAAPERDIAQAVEESKPVEVAEQVVYTGGSAGQPPIWVTHWCAQLPVSLRSALAVPGVTDAGPVLLLHSGGGVGADDLLPAMVRDEKPWLLDDLAYASWEAGLAPIVVELGRRYAVLELVRDDEWLAPLMQAAGLATISTRLEAVPGEHGVYEREVTVVDSPVLIGAAVEESGLVLRFASRAEDSADKWSQGLSALRDGFAAEGMNTAHLHVVDGPEGCIELRFNDTEELVASVKE
ncbi:hypothetical protein [Mycobacteroides abscessus]|uniref:hypothetical protein n=1 Tax=Mycobacteroides abscessus TaxID=36809 RepID=UPI0009A6D51C|nr:hypothetical protein [Mycobacteroides abscessus]MBE5502866.1 hypothetical protein [Mycobacteroides abscessus]SLE83681.1 Uncharacterised protein [Mycobacteroides abscessus subsp. massiliense]